MHNRQAPNQEERSKALGKLTLAGSLALLLIASLMAFSFTPSTGYRAIS